MVKERDMHSHQFDNQLEIIQVSLWNDTMKTYGEERNSKDEVVPSIMTDCGRLTKEEEDLLKVNHQGTKTDCCQCKDGKACKRNNPVIVLKKIKMVL